MGVLGKAIGTAAGAVRLGMGLAGGVLGLLRGGGADDDDFAPPTPARDDARDADLADTVRTVIFRGMRSADRGAVDVSVDGGEVYLRGTARNPQQIRTLEARARAIPEVSDVHVELRLPSTPAGRDAAAVGS